jgi:hypothetical protein
MSPLKTDATTPCKCGGTMKITMVEPLQDEPTMMQHTFECACGEKARFKFPKKTA